MDNWMFALGAALCVFLVLVIVRLLVRRFVIRLGRANWPREWLTDLVQHTSLGVWLSIALLLSLGFGLTVVALSHPAPPASPPCCSGPPGVDPTLKAQLQDLIVAQQRAADALDRIADQTPDGPNPPPRSTAWSGYIIGWVLALAALLIVVGAITLGLSTRKGKEQLGVAGSLVLLSGSVLGGLALIGELHIAPRMEFTLLKWTDTRRTIVRGPQNVKQEGAGAGPASGVSLSCLNGHRVGPFESKAWKTIGVDQVARLNAWVEANQAWGYLLIGSTDPRSYTSSTFPKNNAELAQARANTAAALIKRMDAPSAPATIVLNATLPVARLIETDETRAAAREVLICPLTTEQTGV